ncbi:GrxC Glutaredoxin and related proteins [uncultured Caudovirales phage]|uniref:GrxC Glutaredoxin and related proteins n=1 Tax=uncultured Caudovirales phage TaxID=2100421 RepID=A0A6J5NAT8_9CAUD|nr:GrxC Glutaredoxin and related proteins [uncultured Caudovirales phage]
MTKVPVTVYTLPNCVQCVQTKRQFDKLGIDYAEVNLEDHPDKVAEFTTQGLTAAPIVTTDVKVWSGFRIGKIESLANYIRSIERETAK